MAPPADRAETQAYPGTGNRSIAVASLLALACTTLTGCPPVPRGFGSPDPNMRIRAILEVQPGQTEHIPDLIGQLESIDPAARLLAAAKLRELTGESFGYSDAAPEWERQAAIDRWRAWADEQGLLAGNTPARPDHGGGLAPND